jgi:hypothetical protein
VLITYDAPFEVAPASTTYAFSVTVTNAAKRLGGAGGLLTIPSVPDERASLANPQRYRPPRHLILGNPSTNANSIWFTWDNNTAPAVGGPGFELAAGMQVQFEVVGDTFYSHGPGDKIAINAGSALQFIATANTTLNVTFSD